MTKTATGLMPILATPFDSSGALDRPSFRRLLEFELESGVDGVAVFGMASEGFALRTDERRIILDDVRDVVGGAVPVIAGVNATSTVGAIEQAREAVEGGADVLMVLPPYMVKPAPASLVDFYGQVAASTPAHIMVQDAPGATGVAMSPALIAELSRIDGVESVKVEAPPTAPKVGAVIDALDSNDFAIIGGQNALFCLEEYARGAIGTMPACEFPDLLKPILDDWRIADLAAARDGFQRLLPLILLGLQPGIAWSVHKEVLVARGIIAHAAVRYPAVDVDAGTRIAIRVVLDELGLRAGAVRARA
ncbi:dihydrodipicolinate synthase family protein [Agromyces sp. NPDC058104]|uniref:dihydrodipicolinate synthase family protein n=1 Tax=Agromyces sp. NPDC058104 TaxID=3346342 RepID=UPI0036DA28F6